MIKQQLSFWITAPLLKKSTSYPKLHYIIIFQLFDHGGFFFDNFLIFYLKAPPTPRATCQWKSPVLNSLNN